MTRYEDIVITVSTLGFFLKDEKIKSGEIIKVRKERVLISFKVKNKLFRGEAKEV